MIESWVAQQCDSQLQPRFVSKSAWGTYKTCRPVDEIFYLLSESAHPLPHKQSEAKQQSRQLLWPQLVIATPTTGISMSGRGKGAKGIGRGGGLRHRKRWVGSIHGITKPDIRRLARRGGVKRMSGLCYDETRNALKYFLQNIIRDATTYAEHAKRKTVTALVPLSVIWYRLSSSSIAFFLKVFPFVISLILPRSFLHC